MKSLIYNKNLFDKNIVGIESNDFCLKIAPNKEVDEWVKKYHYSKKNTPNRFLSFFVNKNKGFLQLGYGIRPRKKHTISELIKKDNYCEFDRMWLSDELPKNSESQVISLLISFLKQAYPKIKFIITYADESVGNKGTIYKATNAIEISSVPVDFYLLPDGERIHPVSMLHRHKTRKWSVVSEIYPGIKHIKGDFKQKRFLYILNKKYKKIFNAVEVSREIRTNTIGEGEGQYLDTAQ